MNLVVSIWGPEKSAKTSLGLTFPRPVSVHDFDMGYDRASWRVVGNGTQPTDYHCESYPSPLNITVQKNQPLRGYKELWYRFLTNYMKDLQDPEVKTIMIDTATQAWQICHMAYLQEKQEAQLPLGADGRDKQGRPLRESLIPIEYAEPNARMRAVEQAGKGYGKNLVITHYQSAVYERRMSGDRVEEYDSGEKQMDGFKHTANLSDIVLRTRIDHGTPKAVITVCGLSLNMVGVEFEVPTYDKIMESLAALRTI